MKRRTRLRKLGLLPAPPPVPAPAYTGLFGAFALGLVTTPLVSDPLVRQLLAALATTRLSSSWALNPDMQADARQYGVEFTVNTLSQTGHLPSDLRGRFPGVL